jgi:hypothetical protein
MRGRAGRWDPARSGRRDMPLPHPHHRRERISLTRGRHAPRRATEHPACGELTRELVRGRSELLLERPSEAVAAREARPGRDLVDAVAGGEELERRAESAAQSPLLEGEAGAGEEVAAQRARAREDPGRPLLDGEADRRVTQELLRDRPGTGGLGHERGLERGERVSRPLGTLVARRDGRLRGRRPQEFRHAALGVAVPGERRDHQVEVLDQPVLPYRGDGEPRGLLRGLGPHARGRPQREGDGARLGGDHATVPPRSGDPQAFGIGDAEALLVDLHAGRAVADPDQQRVAGMTSRLGPHGRDRRRARRGEGGGRRHHTITIWQSTHTKIGKGDLMLSGGPSRTHGARPHAPDEDQKGRPSACRRPHAG